MTRLERDDPCGSEVDGHGARLPGALHEPPLGDGDLALALDGRDEAKRPVEEGRVGVEDELVESEGRDR